MLTTVVDAAEEVAYRLIGSLENRWAHTRGVASRARALAGPLDVDPELLVAAAWLHDVGYAAPIVVTGFHPLDGARHLVLSGWSSRLAGLVAHHSGARFVAAARGLGAALASFRCEVGMLADALTYADQTVGPCGEPMTPVQRRVEMLHRHGPESWNARVDHVRGPHLRAIAARVEHRIGVTSTLRPRDGDAPAGPVVLVRPRP